MATEWYFQSGGSVSGPYSSSELKQLAQRGVVNANTQVRRGLERNWVPATRVSGLLDEAESRLPVPPLPPPVLLPTCGEIRATEGVAPASASRRGLHGISIPGWAVIAASLTLMAVAVTVACALIARKDGAAAPAAVVLQKAASETSEYKKPEPIPVAKTRAPVPVAAVRTPVAKLAAAEPRKPESKATQQIAAQVESSVVTIRVTENSRDGTGSGFVLDTSGAIVTNYHVIEGAKSARVVFHNGVVAEVLGFAAILPGKDLAILRINPLAGRLTPLPVAKKLPSTGEKVLAFGAPRLLAGSVSDGIVSAIRRGTELREIFTKEAYCDEMGYDVDAVWIQTTAPISPGNSGGPLVNANGEVVGVNTWSRTDGQNINFAISGLHIAEVAEAGNLHVHPLAELPRSRDDIRDEEQKKRAAEEARAADGARKAAAAKRLEIAKLDDRMAALKVEIAETEEQGETLVAKRGAMFSGATLIERQARSVAGAIAANQAIINSQPLLNNGDSLARIQQATNQIAQLGQQYAALQEQYNELDASARGLKAEIEALAKKRDDQLYEMRCLQVQSDRLLRGQSPEAARDAATAKAWQQLTHGMRTGDVEALLGKPSEVVHFEEPSSTGHSGLEQGWTYKYVEAVTATELTGELYFDGGRLDSWHGPRWALGK